MWQIVASLLSAECDDIVVDSSLQECKSTEETCFYHWQDQLFLDGFVEDLWLSFQLVLGGGRLEVLRVPLKRSSLHITGYDPYPEEMTGRRKSVYGRTDPMDVYQDTLQLEDNVQINYAAHTYDRLYQIRIYMISVKLDREHVHGLIHNRGHKVACYATLEDQDLYLGRPQSIETTSNSTRHYRWDSPPPEELNFGALSPRKNLEQQAEESKDLILLSTCRRNEAEALISTRRIQHHVGVVWDNDAYKNPNRRLPIVVHDLDLYFYNFKFIPPHCVRIVVRWGQFVTAYLANLNWRHKMARRSLCMHSLSHDEAEAIPVDAAMTVAVCDKMQLWISFRVNKERQSVSINKLSLNVEEYENTLNF